MDDRVSTKALAPQNLTELVNTSLREQIIDGELRAGEKILEKKLVQLFKESFVSRTPNKLPLIELAKKGFAQLRPGRGALIV